MSDPLKDLIGTNKLIHEPSRLGILSYLDEAGEADFMFLATITGLSRGNLTIQLDKLREGGLIETERVIRRRRTKTTARLTPEGKTAIRDYWSRMETFKQRISSWNEQNRLQWPTNRTKEA